MPIIRDLQGLGRGGVTVHTNQARDASTVVRGQIEHIIHHRAEGEPVMVLKKVLVPPKVMTQYTGLLQFDPHPNIYLGKCKVH